MVSRVKEEIIGGMVAMELRIHGAGWCRGGKEDTEPGAWSINE